MATIRRLQDHKAQTTHPKGPQYKNHKLHATNDAATRLRRQKRQQHKATTSVKTTKVETTNDATTKEETVDEH